MALDAGIRAPSTSRPARLSSTLQQPAGRLARLLGARSLEAVFHGAGHAARAVQRASPARVGSAGGDRWGGVGAPHAGPAADGEPRGGDRDRGRRTLPPDLVGWFEQRYDRLVAEALEYHEGLEPLRPAGKDRKGRPKRRPGHNLALRFRDFKTETLRFLHEPGVPFTNNQAERDLRMMKLRMKISGAFRSAQGARDFATLRSVLSTARKQGRNRIEALMQGRAVLLEGLRC